VSLSEKQGIEQNKLRLPSLMLPDLYPFKERKGKGLKILKKG